ncbi:hypothetical protein HF329_10770 [Chitinophaga oryzae]|uniref:Uncharacterized protein n=1 Tax=Chitinophaga oryzae TaxID=2725414 RepID=A0AAE6ZF19_9BACT|nr:hypothetical protein [Chitinophaga oryzae]QJB31775.1 hypothetical protein HF329_10770 [Chitinophaga oryzae]
MELVKICTAGIQAVVSLFRTVYGAVSKSRASRRRIKRKQQQQVSNFIFNAHTSNITQLEDILRKYITIVQRTKDQLRVHIYTSHNMSRSKQLATLQQLRERLLDHYADYRTSFDCTPYGGHAHIIKHGLLNVILNLESQQPYNPEDLLEAINLVSSDQEQLTRGIHLTVSQMQQHLQQVHS